MNTYLPENVHEALCAQYNFERESAAKYESIASAFEDVNWGGFAHWMHKQAEEELSHAKRFFEYLADRNATIYVRELPTPPEFNGEDILGDFSAALEHETVVTKNLSSIARLALDMNDFMTFEFMQWFLREQVEEEATLVQIISDMNHGNCPASIIIIDRELAKR